MERSFSLGLADLLRGTDGVAGEAPAPLNLQGMSILVTGAGGSVGSGLCRRICAARPEQLILLGRGEYSIFQIRNELEYRFPQQRLVPVIADVANPAKIEFVFRTYRPDIVYHAAAHKFLSFVEANPEEGVLNNVFGTQNIATIARAHGTGRFLLISTDKAVGATSVLGATKRLAELVVRDLAHGAETAFVTVRFGNVVRSRGSVVSLFEQQIARGGPVTVTHREATRFFMTLEEAVDLLLESGGVGQSGDLCVLDMGHPVRIAELAEALIRLRGFEPGRDVGLVFTGLARGEKVAEQLLSQDEGRRARRVGRIWCCPMEPADGLVDLTGLARLRKAATECRRDDIIELLQGLVADYHPCHQVCP